MTETRLPKPHCEFETSCIAPEDSRSKLFVPRRLDHEARPDGAQLEIGNGAKSALEEWRLCNNLIRDNLSLFLALFLSLALFRLALTSDCEHSHKQLWNFE